MTARVSRDRREGVAMTSCGPGHLCDDCRERRRLVVAERLALMDRRVQLRQPGGQR